MLIAYFHKIYIVLYIFDLHLENITIKDTATTTDLTSLPETSKTKTKHTENKKDWSMT